MNERAQAIPQNAKTMTKNHTTPKDAMGNSSHGKQQKQKFVMTIDHPRWQEFYERLSGPEGCHFRLDPTEGLTFNCDGSIDRSMATKILSEMGADVEASLEYFCDHGGYCDCEIIFNVDQRM